MGTSHGKGGGGGGGGGDGDGDDAVDAARADAPPAATPKPKPKQKPKTATATKPKKTIAKKNTAMKSTPNPPKKRSRLTAAERTRERNRVNAGASRDKKENYVRYLEQKAGISPLTTQGSKERRDAVERAWEETGGGGGGALAGRKE